MLALMMFFTITDVVGRYLLNMPIDGGFELIEFMMAIFVPFSLVYCEKQKAHITVDLLFQIFPGIVQRLLVIITSLLTLVYFSLICWQSYLAILEEIANRTTSSVLLLPTFPFYIPFFIAFGALAILFLINSINTLSTKGRR
ncbi:MAG: TRAP transporter small permease [Desulfobacterium sp.]